MVYIGIDLGGTGIKIGVVDESGAILSQGETPTLAGRAKTERAHRYHGEQCRFGGARRL